MLQIPLKVFQKRNNKKKKKTEEATGEIKMGNKKNF